MTAKKLRNVVNYVRPRIGQTFAFAILDPPTNIFHFEKNRKIDLKGQLEQTVSENLAFSFSVWQVF